MTAREEKTYKALLAVYQDIDLQNVGSDELNIQVQQALEEYES